jgi:hypothetical protein
MLVVSEQPRSRRKERPRDHEAVENPRILIVGGVLVFVGAGVVLLVVAAFVWLLESSGWGNLVLYPVSFAAVLLFLVMVRYVRYSWRRPLDQLSVRKAEVEVMPEKGTYLPGEVVNVSIRVKSKEDLDIQNAWVALLYSNRYAYLTRDPRGGSMLIEATDEVAVGTEPFMKGGRSGRATSPSTGPLSGCPTRCRPRDRANYQRLWKVKATLDVNEGPL